MRGLPHSIQTPVAAHGFQSTQAQYLWHWGSVAPRHAGSWFPDQGWIPHLLHCKVDSLPLLCHCSPRSTILDASQYYSRIILWVKIGTQLTLLNSVLNNLPKTTQQERESLVLFQSSDGRP